MFHKYTLFSRLNGTFKIHSKRVYIYIYIYKSIYIYRSLYVYYSMIINCMAIFTKERKGEEKSDCRLVSLFFLRFERKLKKKKKNRQLYNIEGFNSVI